MPAAAEPSDTPPPAAPLYGDKPTFSYSPKDGGEPIIFPAHSTVRGEVWSKHADRNLTYLEFLWEMDERELSSADQIFWYIARSGATQEMRRRVIRLDDDERNLFFRDWISGSDEQPAPALPPES